MESSTFEFIGRLGLSPIWWIVLAAFLIGNGRRAPHPVDLGVVTTLAGYGTMVLWDMVDRPPGYPAFIGLSLLSGPIIVILALRSKIRYDPMAASYAAMIFAALFGGVAIGVSFGHWILTTID